MLELVEGPTLADRIADGPIPIDEALPIAKQIAEALEAAHEQGIIHRDLKPANVKVKADGTVKVLDFGLAKAFQPEASGASASESPTISLTAAATQMGMVIGTAAYMAPEQASGKAVDKRADVWAFGVVLYEMLTGQRVFSGKDVSHTLAAVLMKDIEWTGLPSRLPASLGRVLRRCLERDPKQRLRDIGEARIELGSAATVPNSVAAPVAVSPPLQVWQRPVPAALVALVLVAVTGVVVWSLSQPGVVPVDVIRFVIPEPDTATFDFASSYPDLAISPDGTQVVYVVRAPDGELQLYLRPIDQLRGAPLRGAEGGQAPFVSPDGEWVGFLSSDNVTLQKVSIFGGPPVTLAGFPDFIAGANWEGDDQIIVGMVRGGLFRVPAGGSEPDVLTTPDADQGETSHFWPSVIPGRRAVLFQIATGGADAPQLAILELDTGEVTRLGLTGTQPQYVSTGHLVYAVQDGSVRAAPFDAERLEVTGNPVPLLEDVVVKNVTRASNFSLSDNGRLVFMSSAGGGVAQLSSLVWVDRQGREESLGDAWQPADYVYPRVSPDGTRVAVGILENAATDLWVLDLARPGSRSRITFGGNNLPGAWSPDGSQLAFADSNAATNRVLLAPADGNGEVETLLDRGERQFPTSWASDGNVLALYIDRAGETGRDLAMLPMDGDRTPVPFLGTPFQERAGAFSPDGRWLAYVSDESGQDEVYVRPVPGPGQQHTISTNGGAEPLWSRDGTELFYRLVDQVLVVAIDTADSFRVAAPQELFVGAYAADSSGGSHVRNYDVTPDGQRFLMVKRETGSAGTGSAESAPEITVVLNWHQELLERVPVP